MTQSPNLQCYQAFALFASRNFSSGSHCSSTSKYNATLITIATWMRITERALEVEPKKRTIKQPRSCIIYQVKLSCGRCDLFRKRDIFTLTPRRRNLGKIHHSDRHGPSCIMQIMEFSFRIYMYFIFWHPLSTQHIRFQGFCKFL